MTLDELQAEVVTRYLGLGLPAWPEPHPEREPLDEEYTRVVGGPLVVLRGDRWHARWHPDGGGSGGTGNGPDHDSAMDLCRRLAAGEQVRLPDGVAAAVGRSWLT